MFETKRCVQSRGREVRAQMSSEAQKRPIWNINFVPQTWQNILGTVPQLRISWKSIQSNDQPQFHHWGLWWWKRWTWWIFLFIFIVTFIIIILIIITSRWFRHEQHPSFSSMYFFDWVCQRRNFWCQHPAEHLFWHGSSYKLLPDATNLDSKQTNQTNHQKAGNAGDRSW